LIQISVQSNPQQKYTQKVTEYVSLREEMQETGDK